LNGNSVRSAIYALKLQHADHSRTRTVCHVITLNIHRRTIFGGVYFPRSKGFKVRNLQHELGCLSPLDSFVSINWHKVKIRLWLSIWEISPF